MKFTKRWPEIDEVKTVTRFAWLPVSVWSSGKLEVRWLEKVTFKKKWWGAGWSNMNFIGG